MIKIRLSKSQYVKGRQCFKKVWLYNHDRELKDDLTAMQEQIFSQGNAVGLLAHQYFGNGKLVDVHYREVDKAITLTKEYLANPQVEAIFEATFIHNDVVVMVDVLQKNPNGSCRLIEVKSATKKKDVNLLDLAIQNYVLTESGINISSNNLMYINNEYTLEGELDIQKFFKIEELTDEIQSELQGVPEHLEAIKKYIGLPQCPTADIGSGCKSPYPCEFKGYCWGELSPNSIHYLNRVSDKKREELLELGCDEIGDIPANFKLSDNQRIHVDAAQSGKEHIEASKILSILNDLVYPIYFLDFETVNEAIPKFQGFKSYQHYVFQYSLHILQEDGNVSHHEYLAKKTEGPRDVAQNLVKIMGVEGSVVVYHKGFEEGKIKELKKLYPEFEDEFNNIVSRIWDLEVPFAKSWYYIHEFKGRSSIKNILPALCPELSYDSLNIKKGDEALTTYLEMLKLDESSSEYQKMREDMLEYCKLDTFAMVRILEELRKKVIS